MSVEENNTPSNRMMIKGFHHIKNKTIIAETGEVENNTWKIRDDVSSYEEHRGKIILQGIQTVFLEQNFEHYINYDEFKSSYQMEMSNLLSEKNIAIVKDPFLPIEYKTDIYNLTIPEKRVTGQTLELDPRIVGLYFKEKEGV